MTVVVNAREIHDLLNDQLKSVFISASVHIHNARTMDIHYKSTVLSFTNTKQDCYFLHTQQFLYLYVKIEKIESFAVIVVVVIPELLF